MLGTLFRTHSLVLLVGLGWVLASPLLLTLAPGLANVVPYGLPDLAGALNLGMPLAGLPPRPVILALVWPLAFVTVAIRQFNGEEL